MITPIIFCGGHGTRLWPLSRKSYPKQFSALLGDLSLFQASIQRLAGPGFAAPIVVTNNDFRFIVVEQLQAIGVQPAAILIEPSGKNTAPAVLAAALLGGKHQPDTTFVIAPSDHLISDVAAFNSAVQMGLQSVADGQLVTFGITPTHAETAYGYLELPVTLDQVKGLVALKSFVEKPNVARAEQMLATKRYLWNAGIFLGGHGDIVAGYRTHQPKMLETVQTALDAAKTDLDFCRLDPEAWDAVPAQSIDCAVMEKATNLAVVPFSAGWSDLGDWRAIWQAGTQDENGLVLSENATAIDCRNSLLRAESSGQQLVGIGLENIFAVAMNDAVLLADASRSQDVKQPVSILRAQQADQAEHFPVQHRPWGWVESQFVGNRFQVKRVYINPGANISLQSHNHRSEHWILVEGTAQITLNGNPHFLSENESIYIPIGANHRLANPGKLQTILIEIRTGSYLGEDDIERFGDNFVNRNCKGEAE